MSEVGQLRIGVAYTIQSLPRKSMSAPIEFPSCARQTVFQCYCAWLLVSLIQVFQGQVEPSKSVKKMHLGLASSVCGYGILRLAPPMSV